MKYILYQLAWTTSSVRLFFMVLVSANSVRFSGWFWIGFKILQFTANEIKKIPINTVYFFLFLSLLSPASSSFCCLAIILLLHCGDDVAGAELMVWLPYHHPHPPSQHCKGTRNHLKFTQLEYKWAPILGCNVWVRSHAFVYLFSHLPSIILWWKIFFIFLANQTIKKSVLQ